MNRFQYLKTLDVFGKVVIGIAGVLVGGVGLWLGYLFHIQQQQLAREIEQSRQNASDVQACIQKCQLVASLINSLVRGTEKERLLALKLLEVVDRSLWQQSAEILARSDPDTAVRRGAIKGLGQQGDITAKQTLAAIREKGMTVEDQEEARQAEVHLSKTLREKLEENLKIARSFFAVGRLDIAATYFYEASKYVDDSQVEDSKFLVAKIHYERGNYREAADAFNSLFAKF